MASGMRLRDADALRGYLRLMSMSGRELARSAGVGHATVNHLLTGRRSTCTVRIARAIEGALECPAGLFFAPDATRRHRAARAQ